MDTPTSFGLWLRQRRRVLDLTQEALAQCAGCSKSAIRKIESDERRPSRQVAELLANCLQIPIDQRPTFLKIARAELRVERLAEIAPTTSPPLPVESKAKSPPLVSLPNLPTPFLGRTHELAMIAQLLGNPDCRLLTLVGPGGIGKTRLALEAAARHPQAFPDGVYFVPLASIDSVEFIAPAIVDGLRLTLSGPTEPKAQLLNYLREKVMLLVLDNFEQLLAGAGVLTDILYDAPGVKLLVTSRESLHLQGEWVFEVHGLPFPPAEQAGELESYSATALFLQSAQRAHVDFRLTAEDRLAVIRLCQLVEGMPLGIELAAAWVRALSCREIVQEIERNLDFLTASRRVIQERHRSIRAVFDHSWSLLSAEEQQIMRQLSVFQGGFRREAAAQIAGATLPQLAGLIDKSLVSLTADRRYYLHELLRQFSSDKLKAAPAEQAATCERHSAYFLKLLQEQEADLKGERQKTILDELQAEIENIRAAWNWAVEQGQVETLDGALNSLYHFYWLGSHFQEGYEAFKKAAEYLPKSAIITAKVKARQGVLCEFLELNDQAKALLQESLALARQLEAKREIAFCLGNLADLAHGQGNDVEAKKLCLESLAICRETDDQEGISYSLVMLVWVCQALGEYLEAKQYCEENLALSRQAHRFNVVAFCLDQLGLLTFVVGDYEAAAHYYQESLGIFSEIGYQLGLAKALGGLGLVAEGQGRLAEARQFFEESLTICREIGSGYDSAIRLSLLSGVASRLESYQVAQEYAQEAIMIAKKLGAPKEEAVALACLGEAACGLGNFEAARRHLREALTRLTSGNYSLEILAALEIWAALLTQEAKFPAQTDRSRAEKQEQALEILALVLSHPLTFQITKDKAGRLLPKLEAGLPPSVVAAAQTRGRASTLEEAVTRILSENQDRP